MKPLKLNLLPFNLRTALKLSLRLSLGVSLGISLDLGVGLIRSEQSIAQTAPPPPLTPSPSSLPQPAIAPNTPPLQPISQVQPLEDPIRLVVQRSKRRVLVYRGKSVLAKYPIAVGKPGWETPIGEFQVLTKEENPIFKSFKTGIIIEPGPDNPLGVRWIGIWTDGKTQLGFHGTDQPELIGQAVSHGCIRMHNKDVIALYNYVKLGTLVTVEK